MSHSAASFGLAIRSRVAQLGRRLSCCASVGQSEHDLAVPVIRHATADDVSSLHQMLAMAADWRPDAHVRSVAEIAAIPPLARSVARWPRDVDFGLIAVEDGAAVGAAWWGLFSEDDCGYGFIDEVTRELSIAGTPGRRGHGVGTLLLHALTDEARRSRTRSLSLSVEVENPAARLYERFGFTGVRRSTR